MDVMEHNREAWDRESRQNGKWCTPVTPEVIQAARKGSWSVVLTPSTPVPPDWFGDIRGKQVLCLASGGGQQAPVLAAAGAHVTSFDLSAEQLAKDEQVAVREGLSLSCIQGNLSDLSQLATESFDLVFHPVSNVFTPDVLEVWRECHRVTRTGGALLAGFMNPSLFLFKLSEADGTGSLAIRHAPPYREPQSLSTVEQAEWLDSGRPAVFSHSLQTQIGGQLMAGFVLVDLYEDEGLGEAAPFNHFSPVAISTRAIKSYPPSIPCCRHGDHNQAGQ